MLLQFTVENYLSFGGEATFSLLATRDKDHPRHIIEGKPPVLRGAAIYGANASGKSNLIAAMEFSRRLIVGGVRPGQSLGVRPFALGSDEQRPTRFEWIFRHGGKVWSYLIEIEATRIKAESLYARDENGTKNSLFFDRETNEAGEVKAEFGPSLRGVKNSEQAKFLDFVAKSCRAEQPFFAEAWERNVRGMYSVFSWFIDYLQIITPGRSWGNKRWSYGFTAPGFNSKAFAPLLVNDKEFLKFLSDFLRYADTGIEEVIFEKESFQEESLPPMNEEAKKALEATLEAHKRVESYFALFPEEAKMPFMVRNDAKGVWILTPKARRTAADGKTRDFPFEWELAGTRRLLHLVPWLFSTLYRTNSSHH